MIWSLYGAIGHCYGRETLPITGGEVHTHHDDHDTDLTDDVHGEDEVDEGAVECYYGQPGLTLVDWKLSVCGPAPVSQPSLHQYCTVRPHCWLA